MLEDKLARVRVIIVNHGIFHPWRVVVELRVKKDAIRGKFPENARMGKYIAAQLTEAVRLLGAVKRNSERSSYES